MTNTARDNDSRIDHQNNYFEQLMQQFSSDERSNRQLVDIINDVVANDLGLDRAGEPIVDAELAFAELFGIGAGAPATVGGIPTADGVVGFDEQLTSDRVLGAADLYYVCVHERIGVFQVIRKLLELFKAGTLRVGDGVGAMALYRFEKHGLLRYPLLERLQAYQRVFGYGPSAPGPGARANGAFDPLFKSFVDEVVRFVRDQRIAEVIRNNADDRNLGSIAAIKRSGLDLRQNVKNSSYGYINVLRVETMQALDEAFKVLRAPDVQQHLSADSEWDAIEVVMWQYFGRTVPASTLNRMAVRGRDLLRWLSQPYVLQDNRSIFEASLGAIAEAAEEHRQCRISLRTSRPTPPARGIYRAGPPPTASRTSTTGWSTALPA